MPEAPGLVLVSVLLVGTGAWLALPPLAESRAAGLVLGRRRAGRDVAAWVRRVRAWAAARVGLGPASRRRRSQERHRTIQALGALAAELEVGQPPGDAMRRAGGDPSVWPSALGALQMDGDVVGGLLADAARHPVLGQLAACWQVAWESGAGLSAAVSRLATAARAAEDVRVDLEGQLAGPRATARMLAGLPLVGICFGMMLGSDPLAWLMATTPGRLCLLVGVALTALGTWWTGRIAARVERLL